MIQPEWKPVQKPPNNVRMVYDRSKSRLNKVLWAAHFGLSSIACMLRSLLLGYYQCDIDAGGIFLNLWLNRFLQPYAKVDVGSVQTKLGTVPA